MTYYIKDKNVKLISDRDGDDISVSYVVVLDGPSDGFKEGDILIGHAMIDGSRQQLQSVIQDGKMVSIKLPSGFDNNASYRCSL